MQTSKYGFFLPEYADEVDIPALVLHNITVLETLIDAGAIGGDIDGGVWDTDSPTIDGGGYDDTGGDTVDGGDYDDTSDMVIDGGTF